MANQYMANHLPTCNASCTGNCLDSSNVCPHGNTCARDCPQCTPSPFNGLVARMNTPEEPKRNGAGIETRKLHMSPGRPRGARNLHAKHPSAISRAFKRAGLDWQTDFAEAIKANRRERIKLWLRLLPYLITQRNHSTSVRRWKGRASKAAMIALRALEGKKA